MHSLKSLDGGILDHDDRLVDVVDDREQVSIFSLSWHNARISTEIIPYCVGYSARDN